MTVLGYALQIGGLLVFGTWAVCTIAMGWKQADEADAKEARFEAIDNLAKRRRINAEILKGTR